MPTLEETIDVLNVYRPPTYTEDELDAADWDVAILLLLSATFAMYA